MKILVIPALIGITFSALMHMWWFDLSLWGYLKFLGVSSSILIPLSLIVGGVTALVVTHANLNKELET